MIDQSSRVSIVVQSPTGFSQITSTVTQANWDSIVNLLICVFGLFLAGVCICRMNALSTHEHKLHVRLHYLFLFVGSIGLAGAPWFWPMHQTFGVLIFLVSVVLSVLLTTADWTVGASIKPRGEYTQLDLQYAKPVRLSDAVRVKALYAMYRVNQILRGD